MKWLSLIAALAAFGTGMWAAWLWLMASKISPDPGWSKDYLTGIPFEPAEHQLSQDSWISALLQAATASSELNAKAAFWTAVTVGLTTFAALTGWIAAYGIPYFSSI